MAFYRVYKDQRNLHFLLYPQRQFCIACFDDLLIFFVLFDKVQLLQFARLNTFGGQLLL